jgi:hypothetical protein
MSFHDGRVILTAAAGRLHEHDEQRDHDERRDHQQLVIVDASNDLRLTRDHGVKRGAASLVVVPCDDKWAVAMRVFQMGV